MSDDTHRQMVLERLATHAEELQPDVEGRRESGQRILYALHSALTEAARAPRGSVYSSVVRPDGSVVISSVITAMINREGSIRLVKLDGEELESPPLKFDPLSRTWLHGYHPALSPLLAILHVLLPALRTTSGSAKIGSVETIAEEKNATHAPAGREDSVPTVAATRSENVIPLYPDRTPVGPGRRGKRPRKPR